MSRFILAISTLMFGGVSHAGLLFDFSEVPQAIPNGYLVQGVSLTWSNPASLSLFQYGATMDTGSFGVTLMNDPILQGSTDGILAIHFSSPVTALSFALAACCGPITDGIGATVSFSSDTQPVPVTLIEPLQFLSQGQFLYAGPPVSDFALTFPGVTMFALDNLAFETPGSTALATPEPASSMLAVLGLVALVVLHRKRASARDLGRSRPDLVRAPLTGE